MIYPGKNLNNTHQVYNSVRNLKRNFASSLPWTGSSLGITTSNTAFNPAFKVYGLPLSDMSRPQSSKYSKFDSYVDEFKTVFNVGNLVNAIIINPNDPSSQDDNIGICGKISRYIIDYENKRIRVFVFSDVHNEEYEVHTHTIFNKDEIYENLKIFLTKTPK